MSSTRTRAARSEIDDRLQIVSQEFLSSLQAAGRASSTIRNYERIIFNLKEFLESNHMADDVRLFNKKLIAAYADHVWNELKIEPNGKIEWLARVKILFRWLASNGIILSDPTAVIHLPSIKRRYPVYWTQAEMANFLESITDLADRAMLELLYSSGLRAGEICRLNLSDINFADGTVRILNGKCKKDRMVPVGKTALYYLDRYIQEVRGFHAGALFFHHSTGTPQQPWYLRLVIEKHRSSAHIKKKCLPRTFRHSFAIHLLENGADIRYIAAMMGHEDLGTTQKYTNVVPAELKRAHLKAHPTERRRTDLSYPKPLRKMPHRLPAILQK